jgi:GT2 family glycosyltransferase
VTVCFVSSINGNRFMTELLEGVAVVLADAGVAVKWAFDRFPHFDEPTAYVVIPHEFFALAPVADWPDDDQLARTISFCVEMPGTIWFDYTAGYGAHTAAAVCINRSATAELCRRGVPTEHFQLGYTRAWDRWCGDVDRPRPIDVLYMGSTDARRDRFLAGYAHLLWSHRSKIMVPPIEPRTVRRPDYFIGDEKYALIGSARLLINLHRGDSRSLEWLRVLECISNGCVVVSEHSLDHEPLVPGEHLVSGSPESLGLLADHLLHDPEHLGRLQRCAYDYVRSELRMEPAAARLAEIADDLAGRRPGSSGSPGAAERLPAQPPAPGRPGAPPPLDPIGAEFARLRVGLHRLAVSNLETRHLLQVLFAQPGDGWDADGIRIAAGSPAMADAKPRVSVLVPLYNHESEVTEALESVAGSRYRDVELLVYDDASADRSLERAVEFVDAHPWLPATVFQGYRNCGPSRARNVLTARARGEFVFMLDSDNMIYPTTLERLTDLLDESPSASFAYSMLAAHTGGAPTGLVSARPWNPADLQVGNYVDTMAMIRRDALLTVGGFCEDFRMTSWEDYDLWCRFAVAGRQGVLLPEILGWYRRTRHSRDSNTWVDTAALLSLIRERSPGVFAPMPD